MVEKSKVFTRSGCWKAPLLLLPVLVLCPLLTAQTAPAVRPAAGPTPAAERALLDQYCVTCHSDKIKTANFSLQSADINAVGDHPEIWERVIRKLRAGMMPPPGMPRPPLAKYEQLRDWLEAEIDRRRPDIPTPGRLYCIV